MKLLLVFLCILGSVKVQAEENYQEWRRKSEERLKSEKGWLSVVGLHWLKEGQNSLGSDFKNDLRLPKSAPGTVGAIEKKGDQYTLHIQNDQDLKIDGKKPKGKAVPLQTDVEGKPTKMEQGELEFFLITRKNGTGLRVKDPNSEARRNFKGRKWMPVKEDLVIEANWIALKEPKILKVPDVLGNVNEEKAPGYAEFELQGQKHRLYPTAEGDELFFVFKDATSGKSTYGSARFLYAKAPASGKVILDFNKAVNPPCAFTNYATCPKAPEENILKVAINAGELPPTGH